MFQGRKHVSTAQGFINSGVHKTLTHERTRQWGEPYKNEFGGGEQCEPVNLLKLNAKLCEPVQFCEEEVPGFHEILKGASHPKVIKDPGFAILIWEKKKTSFLLK